MASIKDSIELKSAFKNIVSNFVLIVEAKPVTKNLTNFQMKLIHRFIYCNKFYSSIGYGGTKTLGTFLEQFLSMGIPAQFYGKIFWNKAIAQTNLEK